MGLESPDRISEEVNDLQNEAKPAFIGKLDLNLAVSREEAVEGYGHENEASGNKSQVDLNHQGQHGSPSLHTDVRLEEPESPCTNSRLPLKTELDLAEVSTRNIAYDQERSPSLPSSRDKHYHEEREVVSGSSNKSSSPIEVEAFSNEMRKGDSNHCLWKSPSEVDIHHQGELMEQENSDICRANSPLHDEKLKEKFSGSLHYEKTESTYEGMEAGSADHHMVKFSSPVRMQHNPDEPEKEESYHAKRAPSENEKMDLHCSDLHSPHRNPERSSSPVRPMFTSPERSPYVQQSPGQRPISPPQVVQDPMHSPRSIRQRWSPSLDRQTKDVKRTSSQGHLSPARQTSPPRRQSQHDSQSRDDSSQRHLSRSPRRHHSPSDDRRPGRSESGSPSRRKDSSACRRDNRDRSRSRSPNIRDRHRRSPRRRHSPRRRTPSGYYSRHRSPRRRPWSPPPNRNTGVGRPGNNLFVAGFSFVTTERDLERKFSRFGRVRDVRIVRDKRSGDSRGFGFLSLERDEDADAAIRALDQTEWNGRIVLVEKSKAR